MEIDKDGNKIWLQNGKKHRDDGPAVCEATTRQGVIVEYADGDKLWFQNGKSIVLMAQLQNTHLDTKHGIKMANCIAQKISQLWNGITDVQNGTRMASIMFQIGRIFMFVEPSRLHWVYFVTCPF